MSGRLRIDLFLLAWKFPLVDYSNCIFGKHSARGCSQRRDWITHDYTLQLCPVRLEGVGWIPDVPFPKLSQDCRNCSHQVPQGRRTGRCPGTAGRGSRGAKSNMGWRECRPVGSVVCQMKSIKSWRKGKIFTLDPFKKQSSYLSTRLISNSVKQIWCEEHTIWDFIETFIKTIKFSKVISKAFNIIFQFFSWI